MEIVGVPSAGLSRCESMHINGGGCNENYYDEDCEECPFNKGDDMENLNDLLLAYRDMVNKYQHHIDDMNTIKKEIAKHVKETGETGDVEGVTVSIRKGSTRTTWNGKALEGYAAAHPEIEQFKTVKESSPSVTIKVKL